MQTRCKSSAGGQKEGEMEEDSREEHRQGSLVRLPVSYYLSHLLDETVVPTLAEREVEDGGMKEKTVV